MKWNYRLMLSRLFNRKLHRWTGASSAFKYSYYVWFGEYFFDHYLIRWWGRWAAESRNIKIKISIKRLIQFIYGTRKSTFLEQSTNNAKRIKTFAFNAWISNFSQRKFIVCTFIHFFPFSLSLFLYLSFSHALTYIKFYKLLLW